MAQPIILMAQPIILESLSPCASLRVDVLTRGADPSQKHILEQFDPLAQLSSPIHKWCCDSLQ